MAINSVQHRYLCNNAISKSVKTENVILCFLILLSRQILGTHLNHNLRIGAKIRLKRLLHVPQLILTKTCVFTAAKLHGCNSMILTVELCPNIIKCNNRMNQNT